MAITATYTISPGSQPVTSGARQYEDTVSIAFAGLASSTTYLATISIGSATGPSLPTSGDAAANNIGWNDLLTAGSGVYSYVFTTGAAQTTQTIKFVPMYPGTYTVGIYVIAFSNTMSGGATFTAVSAA